MRLVAILIVIVIGVSLFSSGAPFHSFGWTGVACIQMLDVCHSSTPVVNPELPYILTAACNQAPLQLIGLCEPDSTELNPLIFAFQEERPPNF